MELASDMPRRGRPRVQRLTDYWVKLLFALCVSDLPCSCACVLVLSRELQQQYVLLLYVLGCRIICDLQFPELFWIPRCLKWSPWANICNQLATGAFSRSIDQQNHSASTSRKRQLLFVAVDITAGTGITYSYSGEVNY